MTDDEKGTEVAATEGAASNGGSIWKIVGIAGLVIGLIGGTVGLTSALGPAKDVARLDTTTYRNEVRGVANERNIAVINSKLDTLLSDVKDIKAALR